MTPSLAPPAPMAPTLPPPTLHRVATTRAARSDTPLASVVSFTSPLDEREPAPIKRPRAVLAYRLVVAALGVAAVVLATQVSLGLSGDGVPTSPSLRFAAFIIGVTYLLAQILFASWTLRERNIIDGLRWRSFRRETWTGSWAVGWVVTPIAALCALSLCALADANEFFYLLTGALLATTRVLMLRELGTNMSRVVFRGRRGMVPWGVVTAAADLLVIGIVVNAFIEIEPRRAMLEFSAGWATVALVVTGMFTLAYMKRVERWVLEWWDARYGVTEQDVLDVLSVVRMPAAVPEAFDGRRLLPMLPFNIAVVLAYWAAGTATLYLGATIWERRDELTFASDPDAVIDDLGRSFAIFVVSIAAMQCIHGIWAVAQAWNARRCTLAAPSALGMAVLFLIAPGIAAAGLWLAPDYTVLFISLALLVNLGAWAASFGALSRTIQSLGRSARPFALWTTAIALHWVLGFLTRPVALLEDDVTYAGFVIVFSVIDALIFAVASVYAWHAMRSISIAARDFEQIKRL